MDTIHTAWRAIGSACALAALLVFFAFVPAALAETGAGQGTLAIDNCHVKHSSAAGGFSWFYCGIVANSKSAVSFQYRVNLTTFKPNTGGTWDRGSGSERLGAGETIFTLKFAVRKLTPAQVRKSLKVTLSNAQGAEITDASAVALSS
jgi:hypothetical protein